MGICSGVVTRGNDPARQVRVRGETRLGMTREVYTDREGRFVLEWSNNDRLERVYAAGRCCAKAVRSGSRVHLRIG